MNEFIFKAELHVLDLNKRKELGLHNGYKKKKFRRGDRT